MQLPSLLAQINGMDIERRKRGKMLLEENASKQQDLSFPSAPLILWTVFFCRLKLWKWLFQEGHPCNRIL
jgi:hypothetical protein